MTMIKIWNYTTAAAISSLVMLSSCSSSSATNNSNSANLLQGKYLQVGNIGAIPTNQEARGHSFPLMIFNNTNSLMNITGVAVSGQASGLKQEDLINAAQCSKIQAHSSCVIAVNNSALVDQTGNIGINGQYALTVTAKAGGNTYQDSTVIAYQNFAINNNDQVYYNTSNATTTFIPTATNMGITLPVYFSKAYTNVKLNAPAQFGASLVGCGVANSDGSYNISQSATCAITLNFVGGKKFSGLIDLVSNQGLQNTKHINSLTSNGMVLLSIGIYNQIKPTAFIITGAVTSYLVTDNSSNLTINFLNNGIESATNISLAAIDGQGTSTVLTVNNPATITGIGGTATLTPTADTCSGTTLLPNALCSMSFKMNGGIASGGLTIAMSYFDGVNTAGSSSAYNVYYYPPQASAAISTSINGGSDFSNTIVNTTVTKTATITNTGAATVTITSTTANLIGTTNGNNPGFSITNNTCTGTQLTSNQTCSYNIVFAPTTATSGGTQVNVYSNVIAQYTSVGVTKNINNLTTLAYSVMSNSTFLSYNPTPIQMWTPAGQSVAQQVVVTNMTNQGGQPSQTLTNLSFLTSGGGNSTAYNNLTYSVGSSCNGLAAGSSCIVTFTYAPGSAESIVGDLGVNFDLNGVQQFDLLPTTTVATTSQINIVIESILASTVNSTPSNYLSGGQTSAGDPYAFFNLGNSLAITLTYKNNGSASATNFALTQDSIPYNLGYAMTSNSCGGTAGTITIAASATCSITLQAMLPSKLDSLTYSGGLNFVVPAASYYDASESQSYVRNTLILPTSSLSTVYVNQNASLASHVAVGTTTIVTYGSTSYYQYPVTFTNAASFSMTSALSLAIDTPSAGGWSSSASTMYTGGSTSCSSMAGQVSCTKYLWIPVEATFSSPEITYTYTTSNGSGAFLNGATSLSNSPIVGASYVYSGSNVITYNAAVNNLFESSIASPVAVSDPLVNQLRVNGNYLYALGTNDIYVSSITPWSASGSFTAPTIGTTGGLAAFSGGQIAAQSGSFAPAAMTFSVNGSNALVIESGTTPALDVYPLTNGLFGAPTRTLLPTSGNQLVSIAIDSSGYVFVSESKVLYKCNPALSNCDSVTLPSGFTTATNINSMNVAYSNGNIVINNVITNQASTIPISLAYTATDSSGTLGSWTNFGAPLNLQYTNASTINWNLIFGQTNNLYYLSGVAVGSYVSGGNTFYTYTGNGNGWGLSGTPSQRLNSTVLTLSSGSTQFVSSGYSFLQQ